MAILRSTVLLDAHLLTRIICAVLLSKNQHFKRYSPHQFYFDIIQPRERCCVGKGFAKFRWVKWSTFNPKGRYSWIVLIYCEIGTMLGYNYWPRRAKTVKEQNTQYRYFPSIRQNIRVKMWIFLVFFFNPRFSWDWLNDDIRTLIPDHLRTSHDIVEWMVWNFP